MQKYEERLQELYMNVDRLEEEKAMMQLKYDRIQISNRYDNIQIGSYRDTDGNRNRGDNEGSQ